MTEAALIQGVMLPLDHHSESKLAKLSDQELLASTRRLVGATNQILAELLTHLAEVEARGAHRVRLCTSLYAYCIYELQFSEDAAFRRVSAARLMQKFPLLYDVVASGELHLTGLLQVGPHLTPENIAEVLARSKHRTKKEIAKLVRELSPLPSVPARIEPLGPQLPTPIKLRNPTWEQWLLMLNPVNHLLPGDRPRDWMSDTPFSLVPRFPESEGAFGHHASTFADRSRSAATSEETARGALLDDPTSDDEYSSDSASDDESMSDRTGDDESMSDRTSDDESMSDRTSDNESMSDRTSDNEAISDRASKSNGEALNGGSAHGDTSRDHTSTDRAALVPAGGNAFSQRRSSACLAEPITPPQRFAVQFTAGQRYVDLVERAQALLSHRSKGALEDVHLQAMELLVEQLERRRFATVKRPRSAEKRKGGGRQGGPASAGVIPEQASAEREPLLRESERPHEVETSGDESGTKLEAEHGCMAEDEAPRSERCEPQIPRQRGRSIPAEVRRGVFERDGLRCTHVDETGSRCRETRWLQFHHLLAFGRGGKHEIDNVTLRCRAHNLAAAEADFGVAKMRAEKERQRHESFAVQSNEPAVLHEH